MRSLIALGAVVCLSVPAAANNVLVLPFVNASRTANLDWIGESVSETIREALASHGLMVLDREDRQEAYRRLGLRADANPTRATLLKIGQSLDAGQVVYGEFQLIPPPAGVTNTRGSLKITARILDLRRMTQGPEYAEVGALEDLAQQQSHLAWQTLQFIAPKQAPSESEFRKQWRQVRVDAIESYIRGLLAQSPEARQKLFAQALRIEPNFSDAAYQLGLLAYQRKDYKSAAENLVKVERTDVHFRQAMFYLGICKYQSDDFGGAQSAFETVVSEVPLNEVWNNLGAAQSRRNLLAAAVESFTKALEGDSGDPVYHFNAGVALWKLSRFDEAAERFRAALDRNPQDQEATLMLGRCLKRARPDARSEGIERLKTNFEESAYWQLKALVQPEKP